MKNLENTKTSFIKINSADGAEFFNGPGWYYIDETLDIVGPWPTKKLAEEASNKLPRRIYV